MITSFLTYIVYFIIYCIIFIVGQGAYLYLGLSPYKKTFASIQRRELEDVRPLKLWPYGFTAYGVLMYAYWHFVLHDVIVGKERRWWRVIWNATLFAASVFVFYNMANHIAFERYSFKLVTRDLIWNAIFYNTIAIIVLAMRSNSEHYENEN